MKKILFFLIIFFITFPFFAHASNEYNMGDEIELVGTILVSKGYVFETECIKFSSISASILKDANDPMQGFRLSGCRYSLGDPRNSEPFSIDISKFIGRRIRLFATIKVSYSTGTPEIAPQVSPGKIIFLNPLRIEELKEDEK